MRTRQIFFGNLQLAGISLTVHVRLLYTIIIQTLSVRDLLLGNPRTIGVIRGGFRVRKKSDGLKIEVFL